MKVLKYKTQIIHSLILLFFFGGYLYADPTWLNQNGTTTVANSVVTATVISQTIQKNDVNAYSQNQSNVSMGGLICQVCGNFTYNNSTSDSFLFEASIGATNIWTFPISAASTSASPHNFCLNWTMFNIGVANSQRWDIQYEAGQAGTIPTVGATPFAIPTTIALTRGPLFMTLYSAIDTTVNLQTLALTGVWSTASANDSITFNVNKCWLKQ